MPTFRINAFRGMAKRPNPKLLENSQAQQATNCDFTRGTIAPLEDTRLGAVDDNTDPIQGVDAGSNVVRVKGDKTKRYDAGKKLEIRGSSGNDGEYTVSSASYDSNDDETDVTLNENLPDSTANGDVVRDAIEKAGTIQSIHLFNRKFWFHWTEDVDAALGPVEDDPNERTYYTVNDGDTTPPRVTDATIATSGQTGEWPVNWYKMGVPAPSSALSASNSPSCDEADQKTTVYIYTYVNSYGEEGPPSDPSNTVDRCEGDSVSLSSMETGPGGNFNITRKRIYRAVTGANGTDYLFVAEIDVANDTHTDSVKTEDLGEAIPSTTWDMPPDALEGLIMLPNGIAAGFVGQDLYLSEQYLPHAWPRQYRMTMNHRIVGLGHFRNSIVVCTEGDPVVVQGTSPSSMTQSVIRIGQGCVAKRGIVSLSGSGVVYPSEDGLVFISENDAQIVTQRVLSDDQWSDFKPSSINAYPHGGQYIGFYDNGTTKGGFIFNPHDPNSGFIETTLYATAGENDTLNDILYLVDDNGELVAWREGDGSLEEVWRSPIFLTPGRSNLGAAQVVADSYNNLSADFYVDGQLRLSKTLADDRPFRLPAGFRGREWEVEIRGKDAVEEIALATTMREIAVG